MCYWCFSKYAWDIPLKNKKRITIANAFQKILNKSSRKPNKIRVDKRSDSYNKSMKSWLKDNVIEIYSTHNEGKSVIAERFIPSKHLLIFKTTWRRLQDMSWGRLSCNNFWSSRKSSRVLQDIFKTIWKIFSRPLQGFFKTSWKTRNCYPEDIIKTCLQEIFKICLEVVFQFLKRPTNCLLERNLYLLLTNINLYLTNLYLTNLYLTKLKQIQDKSKMH